jgi:hypothetical protein
VSKYFSHWVDTRYPTGYIKFQDYPNYYISADLMLCAVYSDVAPVMVYFYGCFPEDDISSYGPLVKDCSPQYFGVNMSAAVPDGHNTDIVVEGTHIPTSAEFLAWGEGSPFGPIHLVDYPPHWTLDAAELSSGTAELKYYVISKPKYEYELSDVLSVDDGIDSIEPDVTVLELDYDYSLDTDWDDNVKYWGYTVSELSNGSRLLPEGTRHYYRNKDDDADPDAPLSVVPVENDVVTTWNPV